MVNTLLVLVIATPRAAHVPDAPCLASLFSCFVEWFDSCCGLQFGPYQGLQHNYSAPVLPPTCPLYTTCLPLYNTVSCVHISLGIVVVGLVSSFWRVKFGRGSLSYMVWHTVCTVLPHLHYISIPNFPTSHLDCLSLIGFGHQPQLFLRTTSSPACLCYLRQCFLSTTRFVFLRARLFHVCDLSVVVRREPWWSLPVSRVILMPCRVFHDKLSTSLVLHDRSLPV